jgi:putative endonuclease
LNAKQRLGARGEAEAVAYLERQGYRLVERNYRCRAGEVDAVMMDGETIVFLEVRARRGNSIGTPEESVTMTKARHLAGVAETYLETHGFVAAQWRVDLIALEVAPDGSMRRLRHHLNAIEEPREVSGAW